MSARAEGDVRRQVSGVANDDIGFATVAARPITICDGIARQKSAQRRSSFNRDVDRLGAETRTSSIAGSGKQHMLASRRIRPGEEVRCLSGFTQFLFATEELDAFNEKPLSDDTGCQLHRRRRDGLAGAPHNGQLNSKQSHVIEGRIVMAPIVVSGHRQPRLDDRLHRNELGIFGCPICRVWRFKTGD